MAVSRISSDSFYWLPTGAKCAELARRGIPAWAERGGDRDKGYQGKDTRKLDAADIPRFSRRSSCPWGNANGLL